MTKKIYILEHLGCANCAAKMEKRISNLPGVKEATITYATKQLRITAENPDALLSEIQEICSSIESEVIVTERTKISHKKNSSKIEEQHRQERNHHHKDSCGCGHEHHHEHHHEESCGCGHEHHHEHHHEEPCGCGHEHHHEHHHEEPCGCGHEHHHEHHHEEPCGCGHEHHHEHHHEEPCGCGHEHHHEHHHEEPCGCGHEHHEHETLDELSKKEDKKHLSFFCKENIELLTIIAGAILFVIGEILHEAVFDGEAFPPLLIGICLIAYFILGKDLILTAIKNLTKGEIFDENFLMSIATLGALAIQNYMEAVGVVLFFRIGEYFEHRAVENSRKSIIDAIDMRPEVVHLFSEGKEEIIDIESAAVGDLLLIRPGDKIPLDGLIVEGESQIDTSPVTGEPVPILVKAGDKIISGCVNNSGLLKMRVEKPLEESMVTRILDSVENAAANKPQMERFITRFARVYTPFVVIVAVLTAILPSLNLFPIFPHGGDWNYWIHTALTFLVISCPCALVLSVPLAFFSGLGAGSKKGILLKGGSSLEAMKHVKAVVMDKTGTITRGDFRVQKVFALLPSYSETEILTYCASCEQNSTHPIANSIVDYARGKNLSLSLPSSLEEIAGKGILATLDKKEILCGNKKLMEQYQFDTSDYNPDIFGSEVFIAIDGVLAGYIIIADTIKQESKSAIEMIHNLNIRTVMLTGDGEHSANAVAKETGIDEVYAKLLPQDKLEKLQEIRKKYGAVMFVGDGINDAPVLAGADVSAAMGSGADVAIETADVVFMNSSLSSIPESIQIAKDANNAATQNVVFALIIKAFVMILGLSGHANMWFAVFADSGVAMLCVLNSIRILYKYKKK